jgi:hypothetical protein
MKAETVAEYMGFDETGSSGHAAVSLWLTIDGRS